MAEAVAAEVDSEAIATEADSASFDVDTGFAAGPLEDKSSSLSLYIHRLRNDYS